MESLPTHHPLEEDLCFLYGIILTGPPQTDSADGRSVCIFAEGEVDRCHTGNCSQPCSLLQPASLPSTSLSTYRSTIR